MKRKHIEIYCMKAPPSYYEITIYIYIVWYHIQKENIPATQVIIYYHIYIYILYIYIPSKYLCRKWHDCSGSIFSNVKTFQKKTQVLLASMLDQINDLRWRALLSDSRLRWTTLFCSNFWCVNSTTPREQRCFHIFSTNQSGKSCQINHWIVSAEAHILHSRPATSLDSKRLDLTLPPNYLSISNQTGKRLTTSSGKWLPEI